MRGDANSAYLGYKRDKHTLNNQGGGARFGITTNELLAKLPLPEIQNSLHQFVAPFVAVLPDKRLRSVVPLAVQGILASQSPLITHNSPLGYSRRQYMRRQSAQMLLSRL